MNYRGGRPKEGGFSSAARRNKTTARRRVRYSALPDTHRSNKHIYAEATKQSATNTFPSTAIAHFLADATDCSKRRVAVSERAREKSCAPGSVDGQRMDRSSGCWEDVRG